MALTVAEVRAGRKAEAPRVVNSESAMMTAALRGQADAALPQEREVMGVLRGMQAPPSLAMAAAAPSNKALLVPRPLPVILADHVHYEDKLAHPKLHEDLSYLPSTSRGCNSLDPGTRAPSRLKVNPEAQSKGHTAS